MFIRQLKNQNFPTFLLTCYIRSIYEINHSNLTTKYQLHLFNF